MTIELKNLVKNRFETAPAPYELEKSCRLWTGAKINSGRGYITYQKKNWLIHRLVYTLYYRREIKFQINHKCDRELCIEPSHLYDGTQQENVDDMMRRARRVYTSSDFFKCGHSIKEHGRPNGNARGKPRYRCNTCNPKHMERSYRW